MACTQSDLTSGQMSVITPSNIQSASLSGSRRLMVSDNPETLNSTTFNVTRGTLWHDYVNTSNMTVLHRVFGWHLNNTGGTIKVGLTVQNLSSTNTIELQNVKREKRSTNNSSQYITYVGQCLAKGGLGGTLDTITPVDNRFGQSVGLVEAYDLPNGYLVGFFFEFTVVRYSGTGNLNYYVRTIASKNTSDDLRTITSSPVAKYGSHPRGSWSQADIAGTTPTYTVGQTASTSISNGSTDNLLSASTSYDNSNAVNNPGHFGATYLVRIPVNNNSGVTKTIRIRVNPRGGAYAGAAKIPAGTYGIPVLNTTNPNVAHIMDYIANPGTSHAEFTVMHAGASSLPLAIYVTTI